MTEFKEALDQIDFCLKTIKFPHTEPKDNAIWSTGTALRPRITEETLAIARRALLIADRLMQEPSRAMEEIGSGNGRPRLTGWKKPLRPGMRVACTTYDEYERAANCFKDMRDQLIREIEG